MIDLRPRFLKLTIIINKVLRTRNIITIMVDAGLTDIERPDPSEAKSMPIKIISLEELGLRTSINPEVKTVNPAATGTSLELTCDIPTQIGNVEIIPK